MTPKKAAQILDQTRRFLESRGINTAALEAQAEESRNAQRRFSTALGEGVTSKFKTVPIGNVEFRRVGRGLKGSAQRCQARSRRSGFQQCGNVAKTGFRVCRVHGASARGKKTAAGIARSAAHLFDHGRETREIRKRRSESVQERRKLEKQASEHGMTMVPAMRGPRAGTSWNSYLKGREKKLKAKQLIVKKDRAYSGKG